MDNPVIQTALNESANSALSPVKQDEASIGSPAIVISLDMKHLGSPKVQSRYDDQQDTCGEEQPYLDFVTRESEPVSTGPVPHYTSRVRNHGKIREYESSRLTAPDGKMDDRDKDVLLKPDTETDRDSRMDSWLQQDEDYPSEEEYSFLLQGSMDPDGLVSERFEPKKVVYRRSRPKSKPKDWQVRENEAGEKWRRQLERSARPPFRHYARSMFALPGVGSRGERDTVFPDRQQPSNKHASGYDIQVLGHDSRTQAEEGLGTDVVVADSFDDYGRSRPRAPPPPAQRKPQPFHATAISKNILHPPGHLSGLDRSVFQCLSARSNASFEGQPGNTSLEESFVPSKPRGIWPHPPQNRYQHMRAVLHDAATRIKPDQGFINNGTELQGLGIQNLSFDATDVAVAIRRSAGVPQHEPTGSSGSSLPAAGTMGVSAEISQDMRDTVADWADDQIAYLRKIQERIRHKQGLGAQQTNRLAATDSPLSARGPAASASGGSEDHLEQDQELLAVQFDGSSEEMGAMSQSQPAEVGRTVSTLSDWQEAEEGIAAQIAGLMSATALSNSEPVTSAESEQPVYPLQHQPRTSERYSHTPPKSVIQAADEKAQTQTPFGSGVATETKGPSSNTTAQFEPPKDEQVRGQLLQAQVFLRNRLGEPAKSADPDAQRMPIGKSAVWTEHGEVAAEFAANLLSMDAVKFERKPSHCNGDRDAIERTNSTGRRQSMPTEGSVERQNTFGGVENPRKANTGSKQAEGGGLFFQVKQMKPDKRRNRGVQHAVDVWHESGSEHGSEPRGAEDGGNGTSAPAAEQLAFKGGEDWKRYVKVECEAATEQIAVSMVENEREWRLWHGSWEAMRRHAEDVEQSWGVHKAPILPRRLMQTERSHGRRESWYRTRSDASGRAANLAAGNRTEQDEANLRALKLLPSAVIQEFVGLKIELDAARDGKSKGLHPKDGRAAVLRATQEGIALKTMRGLVFKSRVSEGPARPAAKHPASSVNTNLIQWQLGSHAQIKHSSRLAMHPAPPYPSAARRPQRVPSTRAAEDMQRNLKPIASAPARSPPPGQSFSRTGLLMGRASPPPLPRTPRSRAQGPVRPGPSNLKPEPTASEHARGRAEPEFRVPIQQEDPEPSAHLGPDRVFAAGDWAGAHELANEIKRRHQAVVVHVAPFDADARELRRARAAEGVHQLPALPVKRSMQDASGASLSEAAQPAGPAVAGARDRSQHAGGVEYWQPRGVGGQHPAGQGLSGHVEAMVQSRRCGRAEEEKVRQSSALARRLLDVLGQTLDQPWRRPSTQEDRFQRLLDPPKRQPFGGPAEIARLASDTASRRPSDQQDGADRAIGALLPAIEDGWTAARLNSLTPMPEDLELTWAAQGWHPAGVGGDQWRQKLREQHLGVPSGDLLEASGCLPSALLTEVLQSRADAGMFQETALRLSMNRGKLSIARDLNVLHGLPAGSMTERIRRDSEIPFSLAEGSVTHR